MGVAYVHYNYIYYTSQKKGKRCLFLFQLMYIFAFRSCSKPFTCFTNDCKNTKKFTKMVCVKWSESHLNFAEFGGAEPTKEDVGAPVHLDHLLAESPYVLVRDRFQQALGEWNRDRRDESQRER